MIVKNETKVLPRLFESVASYIDYAVISDTGSTDGTQELIKELAAKHNIPVEVHQHEWVNFGHNRQLALDAAVAANKADFILFIDADEEFKVSDPLFYEKLDTEYTYQIQKHHGETRYYLNALVNVKNSKWSWHAPVHNYITCDQPIKIKCLEEAWIVYHEHQGAKSAGLTVKEKYLKDAKILEEQVMKNPKDTRSHFYLAQSYLDAGEKQKAVYWYKRTLELNGWIEERYVAAWRLGQLTSDTINESIGYFLTAQILIPDRLESIYTLIRMLRISKNYATGYQLGIGFLRCITEKSYKLYTIPAIYDHLFYDELSICAFYSNDIKLFEHLANMALKGKMITEESSKRIKKNLASLSNNTNR